ncbi:MAG: hypothetical protein M3370_13345 [Actinomycetota bacterium]|nr:hypothetical protein [Actinomycetota bacterium]
MKTRIPFVAAAATAAALALPAGATAHSDPSVSSVRAHDQRAEQALDRALEHLNDDRTRAARTAFERARLELRRTEADAGRLRRAADSVAENTAAARAYWSFGDQVRDNVAVLVEMLGEASGGFERDIAAALADDVHERERAIRFIAGFLDDGVRRPNIDGLISAIQSLAGSREGELAAIVDLLGEQSLRDGSQEAVTEAMREIVDGQEIAAQRLAGLLDSHAIPAEAKEALAIAIGAVNAARVAVGEMLAGLEGVPSHVQPIIDEALAGVVEILSLLAGEGTDGVPTTGVPGLPGLPAGVPLPAEVLQPVLDAVNGLLPGWSSGDPLSGALLGSR